MAIKNVSLDIHAGEILGIAGVAGNGQKELAEAGISLARDDARQIAMRDAQHQNSHPQAGTAITHLLEKLVSE